MNKEKLIELTTTYFSVFSQRDIASFSKMLAEDVVLRDWDNTHQGKEAVTKANKGIFDAVKSINIRPLNFIVDGHDVAAEIEVNINEGETILLVTDIITFNDDLKINSVRAYRGN